MTAKFQRARKPEEKEIRRQAILKAARRLVREVGSLEFSLSELGRRSRVSKPNIYRYFETREEVLLSVWVEEVAELTTALEAALAAVPVGDSAGVVGAIVGAFASQPMVCELTSICAPVLERNLTVEPIVAAKQTLAALSQTIAGLLHARLPTLPLADCGWLAASTATYVAGLWPAAQPGKNAEEAYARPALAGMKPLFERDLRRFLEVLLRGLTVR